MSSPFIIAKRHRKKVIEDLRPRVEAFNEEYERLVEKYRVHFVVRNNEIIIEEK